MAYIARLNLALIREQKHQIVSKLVSNRDFLLALNAEITETF